MKWVRVSYPRTIELSSPPFPLPLHAGHVSLPPNMDSTEQAALEADLRSDEEIEEIKREIMERSKTVQSNQPKVRYNTWAACLNVMRSLRFSYEEPVTAEPRQSRLLRIRAHPSW